MFNLSSDIMKKRKGITLLELSFVVLIIAILILGMVPSFLERQVRSHISRARADLRAFSHCAGILLWGQQSLCYRVWASSSAL